MPKPLIKIHHVITVTDGNRAVTVPVFPDKRRKDQLADMERQAFNKAQESGTFPRGVGIWIVSNWAK